MLRVRGNGCKRGAGGDPAWPPPDTEEAARGDLECPCCGYVGRMALWGGYARRLVHLDGEWTGDPASVEAREEVVRVRRVRCPGCLRTHALLWEGVLAHSPFSERTLLIALLAALLTAPDGTRGSRLKGTAEAVHDLADWFSTAGR